MALSIAQAKVLNWLVESNPELKRLFAAARDEALPLGDEIRGHQLALEDHVETLAALTDEMAEAIGYSAGTSVEAVETSSVGAECTIDLEALEVTSAAAVIRSRDRGRPEDVGVLIAIDAGDAGADRAASIGFTDVEGGRLVTFNAARAGFVDNRGVAVIAGFTFRNDAGAPCDITVICDSEAGEPAVTDSTVVDGIASMIELTVPLASGPGFDALVVAGITNIVIEGQNTLEEDTSEGPTAVPAREEPDTPSAISSTLADLQAVYDDQVAQLADDPFFHLYNVLASPFEGEGTTAIEAGLEATALSGGRDYDEQAPNTVDGVEIALAATGETAQRFGYTGSPFPERNGVFILADAGEGAFTWVRAPGFTTAEAFRRGVALEAGGGGNAGRRYMVAVAPTTIDEDPIVFSEPAPFEPNDETIEINEEGQAQVVEGSLTPAHTFRSELGAAAPIGSVWSQRVLFEPSGPDEVSFGTRYGFAQPIGVIVYRPNPGSMGGSISILAGNDPICDPITVDAAGAWTNPATTVLEPPTVGPGTGVIATRTDDSSSRVIIEILWKAVAAP